MKRWRCSSAPPSATWLFEPFPAADFTLSDLGGEERSLSALRGRPAALLFCGEMGTKVAADAIQIHGGYGYCTEYPVSRHYLDQKLWDIGAGTAEGRRMIIARELLRDDFRSGR